MHSTSWQKSRESGCGVEPGFSSRERMQCKDHKWLFPSSGYSPVESSHGERHVIRYNHGPWPQTVANGVGYRVEPNELKSIYIIKNKNWCPNSISFGNPRKQRAVMRSKMPKNSFQTHDQLGVTYIEPENFNTSNLRT